MRRDHCAGLVVLAMSVVFVGPSRAQDGLVAHYTFEEGPSRRVKDWSGKGNHGTIIDDVQYVKLKGEKGYVLKFNSGKAHVDCGKRPSLDLTGAVTLSLWFHPQTTAWKGEGGVVGKVMGSYCMSYGGKCFFYAPAGSNYIQVSPLSLSWHHVVATFDGKYLKMYLDGKLEAEQLSKVAKLPHGENFYLRYPATYLTVEPEYKCMMDDVRVYNRALSENEITRLYQKEAKSSGRHDVTWFDKVKLTAHSFPRSSTVVVDADYAKMSVQAPGANLNLELRKAGGGNVVASHRIAAAGPPRKRNDNGTPIRLEFEELATLGWAYWMQSVESFPPGQYEIRATITDRGGRGIGDPSSIALKLPLGKPDWIKAYDDTKVLNNLVAELLNTRAAQTQAQKDYTFSNPRDGWVFVSSTAAPEGTDSVLVSIDAEPEPAVVHGKGKKGTLEFMRQLPAGVHTLRVRCEGRARPTALIVRAIPAMMVAGLGYHSAAGWPNVPILPCFGRYNAEYLERIGILDNTNMIVERKPVSENAPYVKAWRKQGKKVLVRYGIWPRWQKKDGVDAQFLFKPRTEYSGFGSDDYDGIIVSEFSGVGHGGLGKYPLYAEAIKRIAKDPTFKGKVFYPYCMPMYHGETALALLKATVDSGYKWAEEKYLTEQPTEQAARNYMDLRLRQNVLRYERTFPGCARHMITALGFMSAPPETLNVNPAADFKVHMDMQAHLLANDPVFFGLYGMMWYHNGYVDEEDLRWSAKLFRHYGIEGRKDRLTDDPYMLPHIKNPDFDQGTSGWTLRPAEPQSISIERATGLGKLQTRCRGGNKKAGDNFLLTKRSPKAPNRFSQMIRKLKPGRTYSLKMFTADYDEMKNGKSTQNPHHISIMIDGVEPIPRNGFHQLFPSGLAGHVYGPFTRKNNLYLTYHRLVFRAKRTEAMLTISDWDTDQAPGGPVGRSLMHNFIEVQPYLDDSDVRPRSTPKPVVTQAGAARDRARAGPARSR